MPAEEGQSAATRCVEAAALLGHTLPTDAVRQAVYVANRSKTCGDVRARRALED
jgi:hypothetical protein